MKGQSSENTSVPRRCIFCDSTPVTKEHAWPAWLVRQYRKRPLQVSDARGHQRTTRGLDHSVRVVCANCNNGWMSDLETSAQPVVGGLVNGYQTALDAAQRAIVAAWAVKTAMVLERSLPREAGVYYLAEECAAFRVPPHEPPKDSFVRLAWYPRGSLLAGFRGSEIGTTTIAGRDWAPARRCSLVIGQLAIRVESNRWKATTGNDYLMWPDKLWSKSVHVWPLNYGDQHTWPTADFLSNEEARREW